MTAIALTAVTPTFDADALGVTEWIEAQFDDLRFAAGIAICADEEVDDHE
jgi:hypothetical protein